MPESSLPISLKLSALIGLLFVMGFWSYQLLYPDTIGQPWIFLDNLNLLIHEAGHWIFWLGGDFLHVLGGSLTQCLLPIIFLGYFAYRRDLAGCGFGLFWLGDNLINVSVYIGDSQAMALPLLGGDGVIHDWHWLLTQLNVLSSDTLIASVVHTIGAICLTGSLILICGVILICWLNRSIPTSPNQPLPLK